MADLFGSCQARPDDDGSDDHLSERGRKLATARSGSGGSKRVDNEFTGQTFPPNSGWYPAFRAQERTEAKRQVRRSNSYKRFVLELTDLFPSLRG